MEDRFQVVKKKCYFCEQSTIFNFRANHFFCPNCTAIYTFTRHNIKCKHAVTAPLLYRHPWSGEESDIPFVYIAPLDEVYRCSICGSSDT